MAVVTLDIASFRAMYPEFSNVPDAILPFLFDQSTDYLNNTDYSLVDDVVKRERLLYMLMAHLAYVRYGDNRKSWWLRNGWAYCISYRGQCVSFI
jgi:hypothetical protein